MVDEKLEVKGKNIFEKMIVARSLFQASPKKKTGYNPHLKSNFFQLDDIIPIVSKIETTCNLLFHITFEDKGVLTVINVENPSENIKYTTPFSILGIKGMSDIQAIGAVETYSRRYLYQMALDIIETDELDETLGKPEPKEPKVYVDEAEVNNIRHQLQEMGVTPENIKKTMQSLGLSKWSQLKISMINTFINACKDTQFAPENFNEDIDF